MRDFNRELYLVYKTKLCNLKQSRFSTKVLDSHRVHELSKITIKYNIEYNFRRT